MGLYIFNYLNFSITFIILSDCIHFRTQISLTLKNIVEKKLSFYMSIYNNSACSNKTINYVVYKRPSDIAEKNKL